MSTEQIDLNAAHARFKMEVEEYYRNKPEENCEFEERAWKVVKGISGAAIILCLALAIPAFANPPVLIDPHTGKFLGNVSANRYDPNSVNNPHGRYGSKYSPDSINNPYSQYGSPYSPNSVNNQYYQAPVPVYVPNCYGC